MTHEQERTKYSPLTPYIGLLDSFLADEMDATAFSDRYLSLFMTDDHPWPGLFYEIFQDLFYYTHELVEDPEVRGIGDTSPEDVHAAAQRALEELLIYLPADARRR